MLFSFSTFNHCPQGRIIVRDITEVLGAQLQALGHVVRHVEEPHFIAGDGVYNVVLESFADDPGTIQKMAAARNLGCRFVIIATEEPTDDGFNHGLEPAMVDRQNAFPAAAALADGILHLVPGHHVTAWYSRFAPAAYAELGFAPALARPATGAPDHAFGFYGKMTWRREQILSRLEHASGGKVLRITSLDVPRAERDAIMRRARVVVQIRANEEWGMVSSTRCASALSMGRPVVAEPHPYSMPWSQIVHFAASLDAFYRDAMLAALSWQETHANQVARFEKLLPPDVCVGRPLTEIGIA